MVHTPARRAGSPRPKKRSAPDEPRGACHEASELLMSELRLAEVRRIHLPRTPLNKVATVRTTIWRSLPLLRFRPWRQPYRSFPGLVIHLVGTDILTAPAAAVDGPRTALDFDVLGMILVN